MSIIGVFGDCHITKNMRSLQDTWVATAMKSIHCMYNKFDEENVELVVCLGDFFDAPRLEAKHLNFVLPILEEINSKTYPTYMLLGNHEAESEESNILEYLKVYDNIHPITSACIIEDMCFIPYFDDPKSIDMKGKLVFTHHDIYGSELASGKTKAFFGLDTSIFKDARLVMNGHVHLQSVVSDKILNAGSLLVSQQGELKLGNFPMYYIVDNKDPENYESYANEHSMIYLTIDESESGEIVQRYDQMHTVLRVEYTGEIPDSWINTAHTSWHKKISSIESKSPEVVNHTSFDMKNYLVDYINNSDDIPTDKKSEYVDTGLELLAI